MSVYFISNGAAIKIGVSDSPYQRLGDLQTGNTDTLLLMAFIPGDESLERELHHKFNNLHIRGEWFRHEGSLMEYIAGLEPAPVITRKERIRESIGDRMEVASIRITEDFWPNIDRWRKLQLPPQSRSSAIRALISEALRQKP